MQEFEEIARQNLSSMAYDYFAGYAADGVTMRLNRASYDEISLRPRMLVDVSERNKKLDLFGSKLSMPIVIAPMAFQAMAHPDGELATAQAAEETSIIMTLSTLANFSIEQIAASSKANIWFQLYVYRDRELSKSLVKRAEVCGCKAIVLTVDSPFLGRREADMRNRFRLPEGLVIGNLAGSCLDKLPTNVDNSSLSAYIHSLYDPALTWKDLAWLRSITSLPILVKGILRADDAKLALRHGAAGIIVSNHGGRQLDTAIATIKALPEIVAAIDGRCKVLIDGGIRRGTDILKAIALGADAVMLGRPIIWGLAAGGKSGVISVIETIGAELDLAMGLSGCPGLKDITSDLVHHCDKIL